MAVIHAKIKRSSKVARTHTRTFTWFWVDSFKCLVEIYDLAVHVKLSSDIGGARPKQL